MNFGEERLLYIRLKIGILGTSLAVQCLRLCAAAAVGTSSVPGWETKIPHAAWRAAPPNNHVLISNFDYIFSAIYLKILVEYS